MSIFEAVDEAMKIQGWKTRDEMVWLAQQARRARIVIDVGCWRGRTTKAMAAVCPGIVVAVDHLAAPYTGETARNEILQKGTGQFEILRDFLANLEEEIYYGKVYGVFLDGSDARLAVREFLNGCLADFIWLDGDHGYDQAVADISFYKALLAPRGILSGHDYEPAFPGVVQAVNELCPGFVLGHGTSWYLPPKE